MCTSNNRYYDDFDNKNCKNWILEKSDASNISDKQVFEIAGI